MEKIKDKINDIVSKIKNDKEFSEKFKEDPVKAIEGVIDVDLPDDMINGIIDSVKAKITAENAKEAANNLKGLFEKK